MVVPMYVETVPNRNSRPAVLLREGWREGGRVRKRTLANLTDWPPEKVQCLRRVLKGQRLVHPEDAFTIERSLPHGHVEAVLAMARRLGLDRLIAPKRSPERDRVLAMVVGRLLHPASKLATTRRWQTTTLAQELDLGDADEDDLYEAMDWLLARQERIERRLAQRHLHEGAPVFADVSGSDYEGRTCPLVRFGYNRDGKRGKPQVVYTVLSVAGGSPVSVQAYPGNTADPNTVPVQQHLDHHPRLIRGVAPTVAFIPRVKRRQVQSVDQVAHVMRKVPFGQPVAHIRRQQQHLVRLTGAECRRHRALSLESSQPIVASFPTAQTPRPSARLRRGQRGGARGTGSPVQSR